MQYRLFRDIVLESAAFGLSFLRNSALIGLSLSDNPLFSKTLNTTELYPQKSSEIGETIIPRFAITVKKP